MPKAPARLGNVNPCGIAVLFDDDGKAVAKCLDTPNCMAAAFHLFPTARFAQTKFPERKTVMRDSMRERINMVAPRAKDYESDMRKL